MPTPTGTFNNIPKLNVWFALCAILLLVTTVWFIWVDYDRDWRDYQDHYMTNVAGVAHLEYLQTQQAGSKAQVEKAAEVVAAAQRAVDARAGEIAAREKDLHAAEEAFEDVKIDHGKADAVLQVERDHFERTRMEFGEGHARTAKARKALDGQIQEVDGLRSKREGLEDQIRQHKDALKEIRRPLIEAEAAREELVKVADDAKAKEEQYSSRLLRTALNMPMLDFAAPKGTPARHEVRQLVLPDVRQKLNYLESYTVDRCVTCHVAIDDPTLTREALTLRMERSMPAINEELARLGKPPLELPAPPAIVASGNAAPPALKAGDVARHWDVLSRDQRKQYFEQLLAKVNEYLESTGRKHIELDQPLLGHPDLNLFVGVDSPHPMARMGCTVCHEGNPAETDFVLAGHTPADHDQEHEWKEKYYVHALGVPTATFELVEHYWDRPMLPVAHTEASCVKCHTDIADIASYENEPQARNINLGRDLFTRSGCINCHAVEGLSDSRRVGPDLSHVAAKLEPGFAQRWIFNPREFRPSTWMPHLFNQENSGAGSENEFDPKPVLRTETEVMAITKYLFELSRPWKSMEKAPEGLAGDATRGNALFKEVGCLGCHSNLAEFGEKWIAQDLQKRSGKSKEESLSTAAAMTTNERAQYAWDHFTTDRQTIFHPEEARFDPDDAYHRPTFTRVGPELSAVGSKTSPEWLYAWLRNPHTYHPGTRMPSLRLTEQEALDLAAYLSGLKHDQAKLDPFPEDEAHRAMADELVFTLLAAQRSEGRSKAIMDDAGGELTRLLVEATAASPAASFAAERISRMSIDEKRMMYLGNKMISHYGCYACHLIAGFETAARPGTELTAWAEKPISQLDYAFYYTAFDDMREEKPEVFGTLYPPQREDLIRLNHSENPKAEIGHTHASFAYHKMRNPRIFDRQKIKRPYDKLKMPNFYFKEEEAAALTTYLLGRRPPRVNDNLKVDYHDEPEGSIAAGRNLTRELNCVGCHQVEDNVATVQQFYRTKVGGKEFFDEVNAPPVLRGEGAKVQHAWLFGFLHNVETLRPWLKIRMPSFQLSNDEATILAEYFAGLANDEALRLDRWLTPVQEYITKETAVATARTGGDAASSKPAAAGHDWMDQPALRDEAELLGKYAVTNRLVTPFEIDPDQASAEDRAAGWQKVLDRTTFLRDLYSAPYPFVDAPRPLVPQERFHKGEKLTLELGCLKCHVLGDPTIPGANANPSAPNLNLAYRRLRQSWVLDWMKAPAVIQPGTKMPALWPGLESAFSGFGDKREALEAEYGATCQGQTELILDFLYNAGLLNHTTIDPNLVQTPATTGTEEEFQEEEEFKEEE